MTKQIVVQGAEYEAVQALKKAGKAEWEAIVEVLKLDNDNFVVTALGTASMPDHSGIRVTFL